MSDVTDDWVVVGRFGRPHGIKGFITVNSFTEPRDNILRYSPWHIYRDKQYTPLTLLHVELRNKFILAQVEGYREREQVAFLTNKEIAVPRQILPKLQPGEFYWYQLIGMEVIDQSNSCLGTVKEIMPTGSNDVLVVVGEKKYLIPFLPGRFVMNIDEEQRRITVDWDEDF